MLQNLVGEECVRIAGLLVDDLTDGVSNDLLHMVLGQVPLRLVALALGLL